ncbi:PTS lactose transporter subunit IIBC [Thomasclavelia sp.]|uniref:PTS lactose transporter subunit IIBC n=1 Tax=Thomasclavelia sp. TaxID=3025757 RepID=UPI0025DF8AC9|nr:PTS lactose transporter subunit IIBC [Thomasclavelia sp.]
MDKIIEPIEKMKPFFDKVARNKYLKAIKDGFIASMPIILFSSIFLLVAYVPNIFGFYWSSEIEAIIMKPYNYSMGILAVAVAATTVKGFTDSLNRELPANNQINSVSTMICAIIGFLILSADSIEGGFANGYLGSKGLLTAFMTAFVVGWVYKFCVKNNITIKMPEQVPPNLSQTFKDVIPFGGAIVVIWLFDLIFRNITGINFAEGVIQVFQPLFTAADGYIGLAIIYGAMSLFWFIGVHGPSIVEPAISSVLVLNMTTNLAAVQAGQHANNVLSLGSQYFVVCLGGTGATLVITYMFAFLAKSKELRAIGRASSIPVLFNVNEPFLFGAPIVLNPVFFVPFIVTPIANIWVFKLFVDLLNMDGFIYTLPWTTPGPIGIVLGCGIKILPIIFLALVLVMDFVIYYPFFKVYDNQKLEEEKENTITVEAKDKVDIDGEVLVSKKILVLCAGGGTSGLLANALAKGAKEKGIPLVTAAGSYGAHMDIMKDYDLIVLAPQVASYYEDLKKDTDRLGIKCIACQGKQYISLTRDPEGALEFVFKVMEEK